METTQSQVVALDEVSSFMRNAKVADEDLSRLGLSAEALAAMSFEELQSVVSSNINNPRVPGKVQEFLSRCHAVYVHRTTSQSNRPNYEARTEVLHDVPLDISDGELSVGRYLSMLKITDMIKNGKRKIVNVMSGITFGEVGGIDFRFVIDRKVGRNMTGKVFRQRPYTDSTIRSFDREIEERLDGRGAKDSVRFIDPWYFENFYNPNDPRLPRVLASGLPSTEYGMKVGDFAPMNINWMTPTDAEVKEFLFESRDRILEIIRSSLRGPGRMDGYFQADQIGIA